MIDFKIKKLWQELYVSKECDIFDYRNDKEFCEENNVNYNSFRQWKSENRRAIYDEVNRRKREFEPELRAKARKALGRKLDTDTNALKLAFQVLGDLVDKQEIRAEHFTQDDVKRRIDDLLQSIANRKKTWEASEGVAAEPKDDAKPSDIGNGVSGAEPGENPPLLGEVQPPLA